MRLKAAVRVAALSRWRFINGNAHVIIHRPAFCCQFAGNRLRRHRASSLTHIIENDTIQFIMREHIRA